MPLYEYRCKSCKHQFEKIQKFSDDPIRVCPECGLDAVEQLLSAPAVQFKGSGWYVTDYAGKSSGGDSNRTESASSETSKTASPKESAPAKDSKPSKK